MRHMKKSAVRPPAESSCDAADQGQQKQRSTRNVTFGSVNDYRYIPAAIFRCGDVVQLEDAEQLYFFMQYKESANGSDKKQHGNAFGFDGEEHVLDVNRLELIKSSIPPEMRGQLIYCGKSWEIIQSFETADDGSCGGVKQLLKEVDSPSFCYAIRSLGNDNTSSPVQPPSPRSIGLPEAECEDEYEVSQAGLCLKAAGNVIESAQKEASSPNSVSDLAGIYEELDSLAGTLPDLGQILDGSLSEDVRLEAVKVGLLKRYEMHRFEEIKDFEMSLLEAAQCIFKNEPPFNSIVVESGEQLVVVGDISGSLPALMALFRHHGWPSRTRKYIFNGNIINNIFKLEKLRALEAPSAMCLWIVLALKVILPDCVFVNRGSNENMQSIRKTMRGQVMSQLPLGHIVKDRLLVVHSGFSVGCSVREWENGKSFHMARPFVEAGIMCTGALLLNKKHITSFIEQNGLAAIIRSKDAVTNGFQPDYDGRCLTVFSSLKKSETYGAVLIMDSNFSCKAMSIQKRS